jgi:hypothetical protein
VQGSLCSCGVEGVDMYSYALHPDIWVSGALHILCWPHKILLPSDTLCIPLGLCKHSL